MLRTHRLVRGLIVTFLFAGLAGSLPANGEEGSEDAPRIEMTRTARTPRGATRVVFELDRPAEHLTVERMQGNGFEVHLLGVQPGEAPTEMRVRDNLLDRILFRYQTSGTVAEIIGTGAPLTAKSFRLENPPRIVVDIYPETGASESGNAPRS